MKSSQRQTAAAVGFIALSLVGVPLLAQARPAPPQRGSPPGQDTPYIIISTFQSTDRALGVAMAEEVRSRVQSEHSAKELFVVPKQTIYGNLEASGYRPDSALNPSDLMELSKQLHGEYVLDGKVARAGTSKDAVHVETRILMRVGPNTLAQPLPAVDGKDVGDAAKQVDRGITEALKGMPMYKKCIENLRAAKNDEAVVAARAGIVAYPNSSLSRLCLLNAYANKKEAPDSIISVANQILAQDPNNTLALINLADAYKTKGDKDKAIEINLRIYRADPSNQAIAASIVNELGQSGAPDKALPIIDSLIMNNPADPSMIRTKWILQLRANRFKEALATAEELMKIDTAAATLDFFNRNIGAAQTDSNNAKIVEWASKASQKFPKEVSFPLLAAQTYRKMGQLQQAMQAARRATEIDPKNSNSWLFVVVLANELNQPDSALALGRAAVAAGADKTQIGQALLQPTGAAAQKADKSKARSDWQDALKYASAVDTLSPSPGTKFYIALASFQIGLDAINHAQELSKTAAKNKDDKAQGCEETKLAEDMMTNVAILMPQGGQFNKEAAAQILTALNQIQEVLPQFKKNLCGK